MSSALNFRDHTLTIMAVVLLLDEADVFLEQRSLSDLERNSLVSGQCYISHVPFHGIELTLVATQSSSESSNTTTAC